MKKNYNYKKEQKQNPYIGFTCFQHFRNDELYSDLIVLPENNMTETEHVECYPVPDYVEQKGRAQGYYPDCSVVYIRILWKEFEPFEGQYNYAFIEDILRKARENNQTVMFRLLPHSTRESDDVPDWVKEKIECPARPQGERVKTSPTDPKFLQFFGNAIKKIAEKFDGDPTLAFMDVSLPGAWGEGSSVELFSEEAIKRFADVYTDNFKNTVLIGQVIPWIVHYMNENAKVGWRADCIGRPNLTFEYVPSLQGQMSDVWERGHVSFEAYWWLGEWKRKGWDLDKIMEATLSWHASTFNAKSLPIPFEWREKVDEWVAKMGYHFVIDEVCLPDSVKAGEKFVFTLKVDNVGVAPLYHKLPLTVKLKGKTEKVFQTEVDARQWREGKYEEKISISLPVDLPIGKYSFQIGLGGNGYPVAQFATDAVQDNGYSVLADINIEQ